MLKTIAYFNPKAFETESGKLAVEYIKSEMEIHKNINVENEIREILSII